MSDSLQLTIEPHAGIPVLTLKGSMVFGGDFGGIHEAVTKLHDEGHDRVILDVSAVVYADSSGIGVLLYLRRTVGSWNGRMILAGPPERLRASLALIGVAAMFEMAADVAEAVHMLGPADGRN